MIYDLASFSTCSTHSVVTNAKIKSKKLEFGPSKCYNIHVGNKEVCDNGLLVHENRIIQKEFETYLGDVISASGSIQKNIESRSSRGIGAVSEIISLLSQVSLGHFHFEFAKIFRDSMCTQLKCGKT